MRIGADVSGSWKAKYKGIELFFNNEPFMPSAKNSIQNVLTRMPLHQRWWTNDPDCLLVRENTNLSEVEVKSLATVIGMSGGMVMLSDDMAQVSPERKRIAQILMPMINERTRAVDWFEQETPQKLRVDLNGVTGAWHVITLFNWDDKAREMQCCPEDFELVEGDYWVRSFWSGAVNRVQSGQPLWKETLPAHGALLLAVRKAAGQQACYLGSDLHISQGKEVTAWHETPGLLSLKINTRINGSIDLYLPVKPVKIEVAGAGELAWRESAEKCYRLVIETGMTGRLINIRF
jgi:alpha-galactosidase